MVIFFFFEEFVSIVDLVKYHESSVVKVMEASEPQIMNLTLPETFV